MSDELASVSLAPYADILHRHRRSFVCTLAVGLLLTVMAVVVLPNVYLSTTLVTIEPQEVPAQYVSAGVTNHIQDRLKILGEKVLSRTQLGRIIQQFNLYPERRAKHAATEQLVNYMRSRIDLEVTKEDDHAGGGSFELSFEYTDPVIAQRVTAELADGFIAEDRRGRTQEAVATTAFLNDRLANARTKLDGKAGEIRNFKDRYQGSLPQDLPVNLQTLSALQNRLQTANEAQMALDERRAQVGREMADARNVTITSPGGGAASVSPEARLTAMEAQLTELRARYSDKYPDVISLQAQIAALKQRLKEGGAGKEDDLTQFDAGFRREGDQIAIEQQRVVAEIANVNSEIAVYQQRVADTPAHQQEFDSLNRDYSVLNTEYHSLLNNRLAAQAAQSLEERGEGEHFRVIDPADLPRGAESPDKSALALGGVALSLVAALGLVFGVHMFDTSFKQPDELMRELELPVAVTIPQLDELGDRWARRAGLLRAMVGSGLTLLIGASAIWFYAAQRL
jgi:polysaccharide chain length determinant protein (PEP-CTERM system associated)